MRAQPPQFTFILFSYNQVRWIGEALAGAFAQTYAPLEILINDDGSTDGTQEIIREAVAAYRGPHTVRTNLNPTNIGLLPSVNRAFRMAQGSFIVVAAGDDISEPERVAAIAEVVLGADDIHAVVSDAMAMDEAGREIGYADNALEPANLTALGLAERGGYVNGAAAGYSRCLIERFGDLDPAIWSEDSLLPFRAALLGRVVHIPRALIKRRIHPASLSGASATREGLLRTMRPAIPAFLARLKDIDHEYVRARFGEQGVRELHAAIERAIERQKIFIALIERQPGALAALLEAVRSDVLGPAAAARSFLVYRMPALWRGYVWLSGLRGKLVKRHAR